MSTRTGITRDFALPDLGEGLEDAILVEWHVAAGDSVSLNDVLCTVETAKATVDLPSPFGGTVVERIGEPGETIAVGAILVRIDAGDTVEPVDADAGKRTPTLVGYGPAEGPVRRRRRAPADTPRAPVTSVPTSTSSRSLAAPPVRKLARDRGIDLAALAPGSGPNGIITRADVEQVDRAEQAVSWHVARPPHASQVIPVHGVRARIAEHMTRSRSTIPDAGCSVVADCSRLLAVRALLRSEAAERAGADVLTPFSLIVRLLTIALGDFPILNSTFDEAAAEIRVHGAVNVGIATDTPRGLLVPVVHDAHQLSTLELAVEMRRLVGAARDGALGPSDLVGSTFTVSNFGSFGLDEGYPVINHPEAAILGIGAIKERPMVVAGEVVARPTANLTCSFDHRVCDGAAAGSFLGRLRDLIDTPEQLLLDS